MAVGIDVGEGTGVGPGVGVEVGNAHYRKILQKRRKDRFIVKSVWRNHNEIAIIRQVTFPGKGTIMKTNNWLSVIIIIILGAGVYFIVDTVRSTAQQAQQALNPIQQANSSLQTQVADFMHPTPTIIPDPMTYITEVRALARLETIQYSVEKVITGEMGQGTFAALFGDKILFVGHGIVIAGVDMGKLNPEDMRYESGVLSVKLPPAEIFIATLDNEKSYVYDRQTGLLTKPDINLETQVRQAAEREILKAATEDGILEQAQVNAEAYLLKFFAALGFPNTIFIK